MGLPAATPWYAFLCAGLGWEAHVACLATCASRWGPRGFLEGFLGCLGGPLWALQVSWGHLGRRPGTPLLLAATCLCFWPRHVFQGGLLATVGTSWVFLLAHGCAFSGLLVSPCQCVRTPGCAGWAFCLHLQYASVDFSRHFSLNDVTLHCRPVAVQRACPRFTNARQSIDACCSCVV